MIGLTFLTVGTIIFFGMLKLSEKFPEESEQYKICESFANAGFWLAFLGFAIFIWG